MVSDRHIDLGLESAGKEEGANLALTGVTFHAAADALRIIAAKDPIEDRDRVLLNSMADMLGRISRGLMERVGIDLGGK